MIQINPFFRVNKISKSGKAVHLKMTCSLDSDKFLYKWVSKTIMEQAGAVNLQEGSGGKLKANLYNNASEDFAIDLFIEEVTNAKPKSKTKKEPKQKKFEEFDDDIPF